MSCNPSQNGFSATVLKLFLLIGANADRNFLASAIEDERAEKYSKSQTTSAIRNRIQQPIYKPVSTAHRQPGAKNSALQLRLSMFDNRSCEYE